MVVDVVVEEVVEVVVEVVEVIKVARSLVSMMLVEAMEELRNLEVISLGGLASKSVIVVVVNKSCCWFTNLRVGLGVIGILLVLDFFASIEAEAVSSVEVGKKSEKGGKTSESS